MKLEPGYYKIKKKGMRFNSKYHFLRVTVAADEFGHRQKWFQLDHGPKEIVRSDDENDRISDMEIIKQYTAKKPVQYQEPTISVTFTDEDGDEFEMKSKDLTVFERILELFPRLKKKLDPKV